MINNIMPDIPTNITPGQAQKNLFLRSPRHATYNFNQNATSLYINQPRLPFEYYIDIKLNNVGTASSYISSFFNSAEWALITPLVKTIDMPAFKIETTALNQYNRKRLSQTKITFDPIKVVFHDVVDGKTLRFWEMYYRYYFGDGSEPGINDPKQLQQNNQPYSTEQILPGTPTSYVPNVQNTPASARNTYLSNTPTGENSPTNTNGDKSAINNIIADTLDNHNFGFNLPTVLDIRYLIQKIDIYQVHGGKFNQVTLVNPRISTFTHDTLSYAEGSKTLEVTMTFEYEYAYYTLQNMNIAGSKINTSNEPNNTSSIVFFENGDYLELPNLQFNASMDYYQSPNPALNGENVISAGLGNNTQATLGDVSSQYGLDVYERRVSVGSLDGLANITPTVYKPVLPAKISSRPFSSTAVRDSTMYQDVNRTITGA